MGERGSMEGGMIVSPGTGLDGQLVVGALQGVVEALGDVEERLRPEHHAPLGLEADVAHERHQRVEDLRDPAAEARGVDVQDPDPSQALGELHDLVVEVSTDDAAVIRERFVARVYTLQHGSLTGFLS
ncbi:MAG: hypothetical protein LC714_03370 [Actinobacteria bacterium]|nr:hypothetical protein [Actinomycetota bacterium]